MTKGNSLPDGWVWTTLGEVTKAQSGVGFPKTLQGLTTGDFPLAKVSDITESVKFNNGVITTANNYLSVSNAKKIHAKVFPEGTTLFAKIGEAVKLNRRVINAVPILADNNVMGLIPDKASIYPRYLFYFMHSVDLYQYSQATTVPSVRKSDIEQIALPLPPLIEQERIVAKIEELFTQLDAGVAALERVRAGLKRYKASVLKAACEGRLVEQDPDDEPAEKLLQRILAERGEKYVPLNGMMPELPRGWCWATIEQLAADEKYSLAIGPFGSNLKVSDYQIDGVPLVFVRNIRSGEFENTHYISEEKANELNAHQIAGGDILITKMGEPPGDARLYPDTSPNAVITADCIKWRLTHDLEKMYFVHLINSRMMRTKIQQITMGVAQKKVSLGRFRRLDVPFPPIAEQRRIVAEVERRLSVTLQVENAVEVGLKRAERLRQAILKRAFKGTLD